MHFRSFFVFLLLTTSLSAQSYASMLAPDTLQETSSGKQKINKSPDSISALKEKLDQARKNKTSETEDSVEQSKSIAAAPETKPQPLDIIWDTPAAPAGLIAQEVSKIDAQDGVTAPASDLNNLLFDNGATKSNKKTASSDKKTKMPTVASPAVQQQAIIPALPPVIKAPTGQMASSAPFAEKDKFIPFPATSSPDVKSLPAVEIRKPVTPSQFKPRPSKPIGNWSTKGLEPTKADKNDAVCIMQNHFENNLTLSIAQETSGASMLAIDYGIEMLRPETEHIATIQIDQDFEQEMTGYSNSAQELIIRLGKNPGFFSTLQSGNALHVALKGVASTFSLAGMAPGLNNFSDCLKAIGAPPLPSVLQKQVKAPIAAPVEAIPEIQETPIIMPEASAAIKAPVAKMEVPPALPEPIKSAPIPPAPPIVAAPDLPAEKAAPAKEPTVIQQGVPASPPAGNMIVMPLLPERISPIASANPVILSTVEASSVVPPVAVKENLAPKNEVIPQTKAKKNPASNIPVSAIMDDIKTSAVITYGLEKQGSKVHWTNTNGALQANAWNIESNDILDAASTLLDNQEKSCGGQFSSQLGVPETISSGELMQMESKCVKDDLVMISVWIIEARNNITTVWQITAPRDQRGLAFGARDKITSVLKSK